MSMFLRGAVVRSLTNEQGLRVGSTYEVTEVLTRRTPFGVHVAYVLNRVAEHEPPISVWNGHLVLERVE